MLAFPSTRKDTAARVLRRLVDAGLLAVTVPHPAAENLYRLTEEGRELVGQAGGRVGPAPRGSLEHHLLITRTWARLVTCPELRLRLARAEWEIREEAGVGLTTIPDLFVVVEVQGQQRAIAIELDRGTETLGILRSKIRGYRELVLGGAGLFGWPSFGLLVVAERRTQSIRGLLDREARDGWLSWLVVSGQWQCEEVLAWLTASAPLTESPRSKGSPAPASHSPCADSGKRAGVL